MVHATDLDTSRLPLESVGRLEYNTDNTGNPDVIVTRNDLSLLRSSVLNLEKEYKRNIITALTTHQYFKNGYSRQLIENYASHPTDCTFLWLKNAIIAIDERPTCNGNVETNKDVYYHVHTTGRQNSESKNAMTSPGNGHQLAMADPSGCYNRRVYHAHSNSSGDLRVYSPGQASGAGSCNGGGRAGCYMWNHGGCPGHTQPAGSHNCDVWHGDTSDDGIPDHCEGVCNKCGAHGASSNHCQIDAPCPNNGHCRCSSSGPVCGISNIQTLWCEVAPYLSGGCQWDSNQVVHIDYFFAK